MLRSPTNVRTTMPTSDEGVTPHSGIISTQATANGVTSSLAVSPGISHMNPTVITSTPHVSTSPPATPTQWHCPVCELSIEENFTLLCSDCETYQHYKCTRLPFFLIYIYSKTNRRFSCVSCCETKHMKDTHSGWIEAAKASINRHETVLSTSQANNVDLQSHLYMSTSTIHRPISDAFPPPPSVGPHASNPHNSVSTMIPTLSTKTMITTSAGLLRTSTLAIGSLQAGGINANAGAPDRQPYGRRNSNRTQRTPAVLQSTVNQTESRSQLFLENNHNDPPNDNDHGNNADQPSSEVCRDHIVKVCRNRSACNKDHPRLCPDFLRDGNRTEGCQFNPDNCPLGRHPHICNSSWNNRACKHGTGCEYRHISGTKHLVSRQRNPHERPQNASVRRAPTNVADAVRVIAPRTRTQNTQRTFQINGSRSYANATRANIRTPNNQHPPTIVNDVPVATNDYYRERPIAENSELQNHFLSISQFQAYRQEDRAELMEMKRLLHSIEVSLARDTLPPYMNRQQGQPLRW